MDETSPDFYLPCGAVVCAGQSICFSYIAINNSTPYLTVYAIGNPVPIFSASATSCYIFNTPGSYSVTFLDQFNNSLTSGNSVS